MPADLDEVLPQLRALNVPVPRPRRLPTESEVRLAEEQLGRPFHNDFRRYLLEASDVVYGTNEPVTVGSGGHTEFDVVLEGARVSGVPDELVPVCVNNGDFFCMTPSGAVVYWSHDGATDESWPSLADWISEVWIGGR